MGLNILETGKMISNKDMGSRNGKMELFIRENINLVKNKVKELLYGVMTAHIQENSLKIIFMARVCTFGRTEGSLMVNGTTTKSLPSFQRYTPLP